TDGGQTFKSINAPHGDRHDLWIDPTDPTRMIEADDGGATISQDGGQTWSTEDNQPTAEFYHVATDERFNYYVYGAQQDNSTVAIASRSDSGAITQTDWYDVGGGESGFVIPDPKNPNIVYAGSYDGLITRYDKANGQEQDITAWPLNPMGWGAATLKYRFQWTAPIAMSPFDSNTIYHGAQVLFKSTDQGQNWTVISPDLTRNDKSKQGSAGGPLTQDNTSVEYYDTIFAVAESPVERGLIWVGSDDGLVHVTRDGGKAWSDVTPKGLPDWSRIDLIDPSTHAAGTAYLAADRSRWDDFHPYLYKTTDYGKTWTKIISGLPDNVFTHAICEDTVRKGLLFAGTETGVYVSFDDGARWQSLQLDLPTVPVHDLIVHGNDLIIATHGRAFWSLDNITPLREMNSEDANADTYLFKPATAYRFRGGHFRIPGGFAAGENPPSGAVIDYSLKTEPKQPITLEIMDSSGKVVRKYKSQGEKPAAEESPEASFFRGGRAAIPAKAGLNRFEWDLRYESPSSVPGAVSWGGRPIGPLAVPGNYQVKLTVAGKSYTAPLKVEEDPRIKVSREDLQKQLDFSLQIRGRVTEAHDTVNQIRDIHGQLTALEKRLADDKKTKATADAAKDLDKKFTDVEEALIQVKSKTGEDPLNFPIMIADQMMALDSTVQSADTAPTQSSHEVFDLLSKQLDEQIAKYRQLKDKDLADFNKRIRSEDIPAIAAPASHGDASGGDTR
ncbi:MAG TPA: glycosyl hydrolase, partial [Candidatus Angelobacter sp.]|nr:glycosyl hydrolase [Candidatus Angelobacter sp.]